jgi:hypothetical protein
LLPRPRVLSRLVRREDWGAADWAGMLRDGVLTELWPDVAAVGPSPPGPADRAAALAPLLPRHGVLGRDAAAWVYTGVLRPARACVLVPCGVRRPDARPGRACAEAELPADDVDTVGGVPITCLARTGADVARWLEPERAVDVLVALVGVGLDLGDTRRRLDQLAGRRHLRTAREAVHRALDRVSTSGQHVGSASAVSRPVSRPPAPPPARP